MSQLTNQLRPTTWDSVVGQDESVELLKKIIENPHEAPKVYIFEGAMGTGKTSCARIFARELNKMNEQEFEDSANFYFLEYDCSSDTVIDEREMEYAFSSYSIHGTDKWKVIFYDEIQALNRVNQGKFLKPLEEFGERIFVIFATTDVDTVLKTLRSRSLEVRFASIPYEAIMTHLDFLEKKQGKPISQEAKEYIAYRGHGHMRNVHMLVARYYLQGEDSFMKYATTGIDNFCDFFMTAFEKKPDAEKILNELVRLPLIQLREDFDEFIIKCSQETIGIPSNNANIRRVAQAFGERFKVIVDMYFQKWAVYMFRSDTMFHLSMMNFYKVITKSMS